MAPGYELGARGASVIAAAVTTVSFAAVFVILRFVTRGVIVRALGLSDWVILIALVCDLSVQKEAYREKGRGRVRSSFELFRPFLGVEIVAYPLVTHCRCFLFLILLPLFSVGETKLRPSELETGSAKTRVNSDDTWY